jgi:hypothetical protein
MAAPEVFGADLIAAIMSGSRNLYLGHSPSAKKFWTRAAKLKKGVLGKRPGSYPSLHLDQKLRRSLSRKLEQAEPAEVD